MTALQRKVLVAAVNYVSAIRLREREGSMTSDVWHYARQEFIEVVDKLINSGFKP